MSVKKELMGILACPKCKGDVKEIGMFIVCNKCKLAFPVLDGNIPDMLIEDAWDLGKAKKSGFKHKIKL
ncbi:MAG: Trm112 family protein [Candidatus Aenigmatarchaeota archaeon]